MNKNAFLGMFEKFLQKKSISHKKYGQLRVLSEILSKKKYDVFL